MGDKAILEASKNRFDRKGDELNGLVPDTSNDLSDIPSILVQK
jgi:hypothetical protein